MSSTDTSTRYTYESVAFPSSDTVSTIQAYVWLPRKMPARGIIQIVHGMAEHALRYTDFALFLTECGYVVCASDHVGHGQSVQSRKDLGYIPLGGERVLVDDVHTLRQLMADRFGSDLPYVLFGHSMGSLVARVYVSRYGSGLAASILCGTAHVAPFVSAAGNRLARIVARTKGPRAHSKLLHGLADGAYAKAIKNPRTSFDWLSFNEENVDRFIADDTLGFHFTASAYATLTALARDAASSQTAARIPKEIPLLFIAGAYDPVGDNGKGVQAAAKMAREAGVFDVEVILYPMMRHEILNEDDRVVVYHDIGAWLDRHLGEPK